MNEQEPSISFGIHFMVDGYDAPAERLTDTALMKELLYKVPTEMGMHAICEPVVVEVGPNNKKDPGGFSGVVLIAESHISFHTFPARGFITIDMYTCKDVLDTTLLLQKLKDIFQFQSEETHVINRGTKYPLHDR